MKQNGELDTKLAEQLAVLRSVQARDPQKAARGRAAFLAEASKIRPVVPAAQKTRLDGWLSVLSARFLPKNKEYSKMFSVITTIILVFGVLFGGSGITLAAAQSSLPDQGLYGLKLWTEQVQYSLAADVESQIELSQQFTYRRMEEIRIMVENGVVPDQAVQYRLQAQIENTLRLATGLATPEDVLAALDETKTELGVHIRKLDQDRVQGRTGVPEHAVLASVRAMIQERLQWLEAGLAEPNQLRTRLEEQLKLQAGRPEGTTEPTDGEPTETAIPGYGPGPNTECPEGEICTPYGPTPGAAYGPGPFPTFMPTPRGPQDPQFNGSGSQPGPGPKTSPSPNGKP